MSAKNRPKDFRLSLSWFTGHLADPADMYSYAITVGPAEGFFTYRSGDRLRQFSDRFPVGDRELDLFYRKLFDLGAFTNDRQMGDPIDGGPVIEISIAAGGRNYSMGPYSEAAEAVRHRIDLVLKETEALVPAELWTEMEKFRREGYDS